MSKNKNTQTIWNGRIKGNTSALFEKVGSARGSARYFVPLMSYDEIIII